MRTILLSMLVSGLMLASCKKESQNTANKSDSTNVPDSVHKIPVPSSIDTLVAAPTSDTASVNNDFKNKK